MFSHIQKAGFLTMQLILSTQWTAKVLTRLHGSTAGLHFFFLHMQKSGFLMTQPILSCPYNYCNQALCWCKEVKFLSTIRNASAVFQEWKSPFKSLTYEPCLGKPVFGVDVKGWMLESSDY